MSVIAILIPMAILALAESATVASAVSTAQKKTKETLSTTVVNTNLTDEEILKEALENIGYSIPSSKSFSVISNQNPAIDFVKNKKNSFDAVFFNVDAQTSTKLVKQIQAEYAKICQKYTYKKILDALEKKNMTVIKEEILEDNTIKLVIK